jgi:glycerophosphoryl diester phosphodiesterase
MMKPRLFPGIPRPLVFGHRGCSAAAPENTLASFTKILEYGVPGVELDVHRCRTGELVVIHDDTLKRTAGLDAPVEETDYAEIAGLDAGAWFGPVFTGEKVPLLDEVFELLGENVYYDIEIKNRQRGCGPVEGAVVEAVRKRKLRDRVLVSSFNPYTLREVKRLAPEIFTALIYTNHPELPRPLRNGAGRFICRPDVLKPEKNKVCRRSMFFKGRLEGYPILPWTVDGPEEARRLLILGAEGIISNRPEDLLPLFR